MKKNLFFTIVLSFYSFNIFSQAVCLDFGITRASPTHVDITVGLKLVSGADFKLGTSSFEFTYNEASITDPMLISSSLSSTAYQPVIFLGEGGTGSLTAVLTTPSTTLGGSNGTVVTTSGIGLAVIRFRVVGSPAGPVPVNLETTYVGAFKDIAPPNQIAVGQGTTCVRNTTALTLELLSFQANSDKEKTAQLSWLTASEVNVQCFDIERSADSKIFQKVGTVKSAGTPRGTYSFTDEVPLSGVNYYRLKMMNTDGSFTYSPVRSVTLAESKTTGLSVSPNPAKEAVFVKLNAKEAKTMTLELVDVAGKVLLTEKKKVEAGFNQLSLNLSGYPAGLYFLKVEGVTHRVVIAE
jgi:hypothetical protein